MTTTMPPPAHTHHHRHCHRYGAAALLLLLLSLLGSAAAQSPGSGSPAGYNGWNGRFNPSMAIIIVVLISAFFFMGFFSIYLRQCGERADPSVRPAGAAAGARSRQAAVRGLDPAVIQTFPTLLYADVKGHKIGKDTLECAVCLSEFEDDDSLRLLPRCDHVFHPDCIDAWLSAHTTCPVCRANLAPDTNAPAPVPAPVSAEEAPAAAAADGGDVGEHQREAAPDDPRPPVHVAITIDVPPAPETPRKTAEASASPAFAQDRVARVESKSRLPWRSKSSVRLQRFPRSHSTGHSMAVVVQPGEDCKRYTLRLPENIRRDIMAGTLQRSSSCAAFPTAGEGSTRKGAFAGEGSSRGGASIGGMSFKLKRWDWVAKSDRWAFLARTFSMRTPRGDAAAEGSTRRGEGSTKRGLDGGEAAGEGSFKGKVFSGVRIPFDCLSGGGDGAPGAAPGSPTKAGGAAKI